MRVLLALVVFVALGAVPTQSRYTKANAQPLRLTF